MITDAKKNGFKMINLISLIVPFVFVLGICFIPDMGDVDLSIDMPIINYKRRNKRRSLSEIEESVGD